jgi:hypothetical protein
LFQQVGTSIATAIVSFSSLIAFLAAIFILPEVYGYIERQREDAPAGAAQK